MQCCLHDQTTGCEAISFTTDQMDLESLACIHHLGACRTHEGGSGTNESALELTQGDRKSVSSPCPTKGSNHGSSDLKSDAVLLSDVIRVVLSCSTFQFMDAYF